MMSAADKEMAAADAAVCAAIALANDKLEAERVARAVSFNAALTWEQARAVLDRAKREVEKAKDALTTADQAALTATAQVAEALEAQMLAKRRASIVREKKIEDAPQSNGALCNDATGGSSHPELLQVINPTMGLSDDEWIEWGIRLCTLKRKLNAMGRLYCTSKSISKSVDFDNVLSMLACHLDSMVCAAYPRPVHVVKGIEITSIFYNTSTYDFAIGMRAQDKAPALNLILDDLGKFLQDVEKAGPRLMFGHALKSKTAKAIAAVRRQAAAARKTAEKPLPPVKRRRII